MKAFCIFTAILCYLTVSGILRPCYAYAEPSGCPYDPHLSIMYNYLTDAQRETYDVMYDALIRGDTVVQSARGLTMEEAKWMLDYIFNEAPELCAYDPDSTTLEQSGDTVKIHFGYKLPISVQEQFIAEVTQTASEFRGRSDQDGVRAIYEYLIRRFDYGWVEGENTQFAYYALKNNKAVCNGYAQTVAMLCHFAGYSCSYIDGHTYNDEGELLGAHAWNVAYIGTKIIWFDTTWDDNGDSATFEWFGLDGPAMQRTHRPDPEYDPIASLYSFMPDNTSVTMHLDVNNESGYQRGLGTDNGMTVNLDSLGAGEYYSPALVVWNDGNHEVPVTISYVLDGQANGWSEYTVSPGSNLAYRTNAVSLSHETGSHQITWYCNGNRLGTFYWTVQ